MITQLLFARKKKATGGVTPAATLSDFTIDDGAWYYPNAVQCNFGYGLKGDGKAYVYTGSGDSDFTSILETWLTAGDPTDFEVYLDSNAPVKTGIGITLASWYRLTGASDFPRIGTRATQGGYTIEARIRNYHTQVELDSATITMYY